MTPQRKKEKTFEALLRQVECLSSQQPVLMVFEDIHWIDPSSRELLDRTVERIANWPVLLLATFRPEFQPPWTGQPNVTTLALTRLDRRDTAAMVATIAGNASLPANILQEIAERTDGVPLFVEELTKAVLESGTQGASPLSSVPYPALSVPANWMESITCSPERQSYAEELLALSAEHGFPFFSALPLAYRGRSLTALGQAREGHELLMQALAAVRATGAVARTPILLMWLAEARARLGHPVEALNCLAEAARIIEATDERVAEAESHRVRGDLLNATGDRSAAERNYREALAVAERQSAKLFELRA
jgi:tetratricopeptide (TPR) repeat protein